MADTDNKLSRQREKELLFVENYGARTGELNVVCSGKGRPATLKEKFGPDFMEPVLDDEPTVIGRYPFG